LRFQIRKSAEIQTTLEDVPQEVVANFKEEEQQKATSSKESELNKTRQAKI
jgi:hypothetical protein